MILELNKKVAVLEDSKNEIENRLNADKEKISKIQQNIQDIRRCSEKTLRLQQYQAGIQW